MSIDLSRFHQVFFDESAEHLSEMERLLVAVDVDAPDIEELNAIFRAAHSIKGGSGAVGFSDMAGVTHELETLLDRLRKEEMQPTTAMIDAFLEATDVLRAQLSAHMAGGTASPDDAAAISEKLRQLAKGASAPAAPEPIQDATPQSAPAVESQAQTLIEYLITFSLPQDNPSVEENIPALLRELETLGSLEVLESPSAEPHKKKKKKSGKKNAFGSYQLKLISTADDKQVRSVFEFLFAPDEVSITAQITEPVETPATEQDDPGYGLFTDDEPGYGFFDDFEPAQPVATERTIAPSSDDGSYGFFEPLPERPAEPSPAATAATPPAEQPDVDASKASGRRATERRSTDAESSSIRVNVEKIDQLINLVGELVITQAMLKQTASVFDPVLYEQLHAGMGQLERNTRDLQESVMSIRMMPISFVFSRYPRLVRDLAGKLGKQIELVTVGENTELDKGLIEKIADPLTHLVRNSLDHGIETPDKRIAAGKSAQGTITLLAAQQGGNIVIEISDDGAGLNRDKILSKAQERGIHTSNTMTDDEVWKLIFEPGFSTADVVTDVSGRGVGMDVVRRNIGELNGTVEIQSTLGAGTKMTVRLPLTLAILDGMTVAVGEGVYVIPLNLIVETLQPKPEDVKTLTGQGRVVQVRGEYLPLIALHEVFAADTNVLDPTQGVLVLIEDKGQKAALLVDALIGQQQVVIKSLETNYKKVRGVAAATIMGDGTVALILDVATLVAMGQSPKK